MSNVMCSGTACSGPLPGFYSEYLYKRWYRCNTDVSSFCPSECSLDRLTGINMSAEDFSSTFDMPKRPVLLTNIQSNWKGGKTMVGWSNLYTSLQRENIS